MTKIQGLLIGAIIATAPSSNARFNGNEGSGGGNLKRSSIEEARKAIPGNFHDVLSEVTEELKETAPIQIRNKAVRPILEKILALPVVREIGREPNDGHFKIHIEEKEACRDVQAPNRRTDASVLGDKWHGTVCISLPRLTKYPARGLSSEVGALMIHELAHLAGYGEKEAVMVQEYVLKHLYRPCYYQISYRDQDGDVADIFLTLRDLTHEMSAQTVNLAGGSIVKLQKTYKLEAPARYGYSSQTITSRNDENIFEITDTSTEASFSALKPDGRVIRVEAHWGQLRVGKSHRWYDLGDLRTSSLSLDGAPRSILALWVPGDCRWDQD